MSCDIQFSLINLLLSRISSSESGTTHSESWASGIHGAKYLSKCRLFFCCFLSQGCQIVRAEYLTSCRNLPQYSRYREKWAEWLFSSLGNLKARGNHKGKSLRQQPFVLLEDIGYVWDKHGKCLELRWIIKAQQFNNGFVCHHQFTLLREKNKKHKKCNLGQGLAWKVNNTKKHILLLLRCHWPP